MEKIDPTVNREGLCGGVSNAVCVDGHVEEVTPYATLRYAIGVKQPSVCLALTNVQQMGLRLTKVL